MYFIILIFISLFIITFICSRLVNLLRLKPRPLSFCARSSHFVSRAFPSSPLLFCPFVSDHMIYGRTRRTALYARQCRPERAENSETSQQCINNTGFTTVWPSASAVANTLTSQTQSITEECDGFLWDVCFRLFWRCSLSPRCHTNTDSCTKMSLKMGFKDLAASIGLLSDFFFFFNPCDFSFS